MRAVWIVDDDQSIRWVLEKSLAREGIPFKSFSNPDDVLDLLEKEKPQVIISDIRMPKGSGITLLQQIKQDFPKIPVIIMTAFSDMESAVSAFQGGAFEYITKPFDIGEVIALITRAVNESISLEVVKTQFAPNMVASSSMPPELIGQAPSMQEIFRAVGRLAQSNASILITGESGTGKELVARALHRHGDRSSAPFIEFNLAKISKDSIEAELFGYERGAFANAPTMKRGCFEQADGGTLFLDEVGDLPLELQGTLLRLIEDGRFHRIGGQQELKCNVRFIASSFKNLEALVASGQLREDLFHRLNVIRLRLPALRDRKEDIPILTQHFLMMSARELNVKPKILNPLTLDILSMMQLPGNVRELQNICHRLTVMVSAQEIMPKDLPKDFHQFTPTNSSVNSLDYVNPENIIPVAAIPKQVIQPSSSSSWESGLKTIAKKMLEANNEGIYQELLNKFEKSLIETALEVTRGRKVEAAERLGIGRNTITRKVQELNIL
jgi:two-component system nitrogen regulation response regulator GlnG